MILPVPGSHSTFLQRIAGRRWRGLVPALLLSALAACGPSQPPQQGRGGGGGRGRGGGGGGPGQGKQSLEEKRAATLKTMTASRAKVLTSGAAGKGRGAPVLPRGGPGGGAPPASGPLQSIVAEIRSAVTGGANTNQERRPVLAGVTLHRGAFVTSDTGYTFRPCGSKTLYLIRGNQEAIYLLNERLRFSSRGLRTPYFVQLQGRLVEMDQMGGAPGAGGGQVQRAAPGAGAPPGGRRRPTGPQFMVTKFVSMEAKFPPDCPSPSRL